MPEDKKIKLQNELAPVGAVNPKDLLRKSREEGQMQILDTKVESEGYKGKYSLTEDDVKALERESKKERKGPSLYDKAFEKVVQSQYEEINKKKIQEQALKEAKVENARQAKEDKILTSEAKNINVADYNDRESITKAIEDIDSKINTFAFQYNEVLKNFQEEVFPEYLNLSKEERDSLRFTSKDAGSSLSDMLGLSPKQLKTQFGQDYFAEEKIVSLEKIKSDFNRLGIPKEFYEELIKGIKNSTEGKVSLRKIEDVIDEIANSKTFGTGLALEKASARSLIKDSKYYTELEALWDNLDGREIDPKTARNSSFLFLGKNPERGERKTWLGRAGRAVESFLGGAGEYGLRLSSHAVAGVSTAAAQTVQLPFRYGFLKSEYDALRAKRIELFEKKMALEKEEVDAVKNKANEIINEIDSRQDIKNYSRGTSTVARAKSAAAWVANKGVDAVNLAGNHIDGKFVPKGEDMDLIYMRNLTRDIQNNIKMYDKGGEYGAWDALIKDRVGYADIGMNSRINDVREKYAANPESLTKTELDLLQLAGVRGETEKLIEGSLWGRFWESQKASIGFSIDLMPATRIVGVANKLVRGTSKAIVGKQTFNNIEKAVLGNKVGEFTVKAVNTTATTLAMPETLFNITGNNEASRDVQIIPFDNNFMIAISDEQKFDAATNLQSRIKINTDKLQTIINKYENESEDNPIDEKTREQDVTIAQELEDMIISESMILSEILIDPENQSEGLLNPFIDRSKSGLKALDYNFVNNFVIAFFSPGMTRSINRKFDNFLTDASTKQRRTAMGKVYGWSANKVKTLSDNTDRFAKNLEDRLFGRNHFASADGGRIFFKSIPASIAEESVINIMPRISGMDVFEEEGLMNFTSADWWLSVSLGSLVTKTAMATASAPMASANYLQARRMFKDELSRMVKDGRLADMMSKTDFEGFSEEAWAMINNTTLNDRNFNMGVADQFINDLRNPDGRFMKVDKDGNAVSQEQRQFLAEQIESNKFNNLVYIAIKNRTTDSLASALTDLRNEATTPIETKQAIDKAINNIRELRKKSMDYRGRVNEDMLLFYEVSKHQSKERLETISKIKEKDESVLQEALDLYNSKLSPDQTPLTLEEVKKVVEEFNREESSQKMINYLEGKKVKGFTYDADKSVGENIQNLANTLGEGGLDIVMSELGISDAYLAWGTMITEAKGHKHTDGRDKANILSTLFEVYTIENEVENQLKQAEEKIAWELAPENRAEIHKREKNSIKEDMLNYWDINENNEIQVKNTMKQMGFDDSETMNRINEIVRRKKRDAEIRQSLLPKMARWGMKKTHIVRDKAGNEYVYYPKSDVLQQILPGNKLGPKIDQDNKVDILRESEFVRDIERTDEQVYESQEKYVIKQAKSGIVIKNIPKTFRGAPGLYVNEKGETYYTEGTRKDKTGDRDFIKGSKEITALYPEKTANSDRLIQAYENWKSGATKTAPVNTPSFSTGGATSAINLISATKTTPAPAKPGTTTPTTPEATIIADESLWEMGDENEAPYSTIQPDNKMDGEKALQSHMNKQVSRDTPLKSYIDRLLASGESTLDQVIDAFDAIVAAWEADGRYTSVDELVNIQDTYFLKEVDFSEVGKILSSIIDGIPATALPSEKAVVIEQIKISQSEENPNVSSTLGRAVSKNVIWTPHTISLYRGDGSELKFGGVLGIKYTLINGQKVNTTPEISPEAQVYMNPDNYRPGDKVRMTFNFRHFFKLNRETGLYEIDWDGISQTVVIDEQRQNIIGDGTDAPKAVSVSLRQWLFGAKIKDVEVEGALSKHGITDEAVVEQMLEELLKAQELIEENRVEEAQAILANNPLMGLSDFTDNMTVGIINDKNIEVEGAVPNTLIGGLPNMNWFNNANVGLQQHVNGEPNIAERERRIKNNKAANREARKEIISNGVFSTEITNKKDASNNKRLDSDKKFYSVLDNFGAEGDSHQTKTSNMDNDNLRVGWIEGDEIVLGVDGFGNKISIPLSSMTNYKKGMYKNSQSVIVFKSGKDADGNWEYQVSAPVTDKRADLETQRAAREKLFLLFKTKGKDKDKNLESQYDNAVAGMQAIFGKNLNIRNFLNDLQKVYPDEAKTTKKVVHEFFSKMFISSKKVLFGHNSPLPNLTLDYTIDGNRAIDWFEAVAKLGADIAEGGNKENLIREFKDRYTTTYKAILTGNWYTNLIFNPIQTKGGTFYTVQSQPVISFKNPAKLTEKEYTALQERVKKQKTNLENLKKQRQVIKDSNASETRKKTEIKKLEVTIKNVEENLAELKNQLETSSIMVEENAEILDVVELNNALDNIDKEAKEVVEKEAKKLIQDLITELKNTEKAEDGKEILQKLKVLQEENNKLFTEEDNKVIGEKLEILEKAGEEVGEISREEADTLKGQLAELEKTAKNNAESKKKTLEENNKRKQKATAIAKTVVEREHIENRADFKAKIEELYPELEESEVEEIANTSTKDMIDALNSISSKNKHLKNAVDKNTVIAIEAKIAQFNREADNRKTVKQYAEVLNEIQVVEAVRIAEAKKQDDKNAGVRNSIVDKSEIARHIIGVALSEIAVGDELTWGTLFGKVREVYDREVQNLRDKGRVIEADLMEQYKEEMLHRRAENGNITEYLNALLDTKNKLTEEMLDEAFDNESENIRDYDEASYQLNPLNSISAKVKLFLLAGIEDTRVPKGFGGFSKTMHPEEVIDALQDMLGKARGNTLEQLELVAKAQVKVNPDDFQFYQTIVDRLKALEKIDPAAVNEIMYNLNLTKNEMSFVLWNKISKGDNSVFSLSVLDANSKNPKVKKVGEWKQSLKNSGLIELVKGNRYTINKAKYEEVKNLYNDFFMEEDGKTKITDIEKIDRNHIKSFLKAFGIELNPKTLDRIYENNPDDKDIREMFIGQTSSVIHKLMDNLNVANGLEASGKELAFRRSEYHESNVNPFDILTFDLSRINDLANLDNSYTFTAKGSMYVGGVPVYLYQQYSRVSNEMDRISHSISDYINDIEIAALNGISAEDVPFTGALLELESDVYTRHSFLLERIRSNPKGMREQLDHFSVSLEALKQTGKPSRDDMGGTKLSDIDETIMNLGFYLNREGNYEDPAFEKEYGVGLRKGYAKFPTISDSSQVPFMSTVLVELNSDHILNEREGTLSNGVVDLLSDQLILPSLNRIANYIRYVAMTEGTTNVQGLDVGSLYIVDVTNANTEVFEDANGNKKPLNQIFADMVLNSEEDIETIIENFRETYAEEIQSVIESSILEEVNKLYNPETKTGAYYDAGLIRKSAAVYDNTGKIIAEEGTTDKLNIERVGANIKYSDNPRLLAFEYVINSFIHSKEIHTIFAGDLAQYFKDSMTRDFDENLNLPEVQSSDIRDYYYTTNESKNEINELLKDIRNEESSTKVESKATLLEKYPEFGALPEFADSRPEQQATAILVEVGAAMVNDIFKKVQINTSKRLKAMVSPGNQMAGYKGGEGKVFQIMIQDLENMSKTFEHLAEIHHPGVYKTIEASILSYTELRNKENLGEEEKRTKKELEKKIKEHLPKIAAYLETSTTDAQEYHSWENHLDIIKGQGRINQHQFDSLTEKLKEQTRDILKYGKIREENLFSEEEREIINGQPMKPLYAGTTMRTFGTEEGGYQQRVFMYIKSSSFPLLPELTVNFPELDNIRQKIDYLEGRTDFNEDSKIEFAEERKRNRTVRLSYQTANKVGGVKEAVSFEQLQEEINPDLMRNMEERSGVELDVSNFYIQQDKPYHGFSNIREGKRDEITLSTQFEKIILGDGISKQEKDIFPIKSGELGSFVDAEVLAAAEVDVNKNFVNGKDLQNIYNELYKRFQRVKRGKLFEELGIENMLDVSSGKPEVMETIAKLVNDRLSKKQDQEALEIVYLVSEVGRPGVKHTMTQEEINERFNGEGYIKEKAMFRMPLMFSPNSNKYESVFNSIINNSNIKFKISGTNHPVSSEAGFTRLNYTEEVARSLEEQGMVFSETFDPKVGLQSTRYEEGPNKGRIMATQVFITNPFKVFDPKTGTYDFAPIESFTKVVDGKRVLDMENPEVATMFSFRIPVSAHLSGALIEIAGILPASSAGQMVVVQDSTIQIGEDFDIDVRNAYKYNMMLKEVTKADGSKEKRLVKMTYEDIKPVPDKEYIARRKEFYKKGAELWKEYFTKAPSLDKGGVSVVLKEVLEMESENFRSLHEIVYLEKAFDLIDEGKLDEAVSFISFSPYGETFKNLGVTEETIGDRVNLLLNTLISEKTIDNEKKQLIDSYRETKQALKDALSSTPELDEMWNNYQEMYRNRVNEEFILENNLIGMYKSVFSSPDGDVQQLITKVLSTEFAESTAEFIDNRVGSRFETYNIHGPSTQRRVVKLGAVGKMGISRHSNFVTINSMFQQLDEKVKIIKGTYKDKEGKTRAIEHNIRLGGFTFDGVFGRLDGQAVTKSDGSMSVPQRISEALMEAQNSATDNQNLNIMGRRNENAETIGVFGALIMNGILNDGEAIGDSGKELSYASLFIAQPALFEYVKRVEKMKSSIGEESMSSEFRNEILDEIIAEYVDKLETTNRELFDRTFYIDDKGIIRFDPEESIYIGDDLTSSVLADMIGESDFKDENLVNQIYILKAFQDILGVTGDLSKVQQFVNIEAGGLGKSYFDAISYKEKLTSFGENVSDKVFLESSFKKDDEITDSNSKSFFEAFVGEKISVPTEEIAHYEEQGFVWVDNNGSSNVMIKPKNHYSHKIVNSVSLGYNLWNSIFPYDDNVIGRQIRDIIETSGLKNDSAKATQLKYKIMQSMRDFAYTGSYGLFGGNPRPESRRIFFDVKNSDGSSVNESLGSYILRLFNTPEYKHLKSSPFFKDLEIVVGDEGNPTLIKHNSADKSKLGDLDRNYFLLSKVDSKLALPDKLDGTKVTEESLMKDLLMYAILSDQERGAIGFRNVLPLPLFTKYGVDKLLRASDPSLGSVSSQTYYRGAINHLMTKYPNTFVNDRGEMSMSEYIKFGDEQAILSLEKEVAIINKFYTQRGAKEQVVYVRQGNKIVFPDYEKRTKNPFSTRQFYQHNPMEVGWKNIKRGKAAIDILADNGATPMELLENEINSLVIENTGSKYLVLLDVQNRPHLFERGKRLARGIKDGRAFETYKAGVEIFGQGGQYDLFEYKAVPILGSLGFNEYNPYRDINKSLLPANNINGKTKDQRQQIVDTIQGKTNAAGAETIIEQTLNLLREEGYQGRYRAFIDMFKIPGTRSNYLLSDIGNVKVEIIDPNDPEETRKMSGTGRYLPANHSQNLDTDGKTVRNHPVLQLRADVMRSSTQVIQDIFIEELFHHLTISTISPYINLSIDFETGKLIREPKIDRETGEPKVIPESLNKLIDVYEDAIRIITKEKGGIDKLKEELQGFKKGENRGENMAYEAGSDLDMSYRISNIHEFMVGLFLKDTPFSKLMRETEYSGEKGGIIKSFISNALKFFARVFPGIKDGSITKEAVTSFYEFLVQDSPKKTNFDKKEKSIMPHENNPNPQEVVAEVMEETQHIPETDEVVHIPNIALRDEESPTNKGETESTNPKSSEEGEILLSLIKPVSVSNRITFKC